MINQISPVQTKTEALPSINKDLLKARHIQAHVKTLTGTLPRPLPRQVQMWSPITAGPVLVPVTRWIE
jgi:hypothetical protein